MKLVRKGRKSKDKCQAFDDLNLEPALFEYA